MNASVPTSKNNKVKIIGWYDAHHEKLKIRLIDHLTKAQIVRHNKGNFVA